MANAESYSPAAPSATFAVDIADGTVIITVTDLGTAPKLTPTGRTKRTMAEIKAQAAAKRAAKEAERVQKALERAAKKLADKEAKQLRAQARRARSQAAEMKRIAAERKRRNRLTRGRNVVACKANVTPHHVFAERLQDDPDKVFCNHIVDPSWDSEDAFVDFLDAQRAASPLSQPTLEETLIEKVLAGTADLADLVTLLALDSNNEKGIEEIVDDLLEWYDEDWTPEPLYDDTLLPPGTTRTPSKIGGGYCKSDIPNESRHSIEARRGNGWKAHGRFAQYA